MDDPLVKIHRLEQTDQGALGSMVLDGTLFCTTLEPDDADPERNQTPEGIYPCRRFSGTKFKHTFEILVPDHFAVLFHPGNSEEATTMCTVVGQYPGKLHGNRAVLNSGDTFKRFMEFFDKNGIDEFYVQFIDAY